MNLKQAQTVLSDLLMKCEQENIALPQDPLETIIEAIQSLRSEIKHEMRRSQMDIALDHMRSKYGLRAGAPAHNTKSPVAAEKKRRHSDGGSEFAGHKPQDQQRYMRPINLTVPTIPETSSSMHSPAQKKPRLKEEVKAKPAVRPENQKLVDELLQLGEYELKTGRSQRGVTRLRAAKQVRDANDVIKSGAQARQLEGIGASAAGKVDMMLREGLKGALKEYEDDDEEDEEDEEEREDSEEEDVAQAVEHTKKKPRRQGNPMASQKQSSKEETAENDEEEEEDEQNEDEGDDEEEDDDDDNRDYGDDEDFHVPKSTNDLQSEAMNLRQAQRALADLMTKCQEAHVQLPIDPLDGLYEAAKALRHSQQNNKLEPEDALDELKQVFGVDPVWLQHEQEEQTKRLNRQKRDRKPRSFSADATPKGARSSSFSSSSSTTSATSKPEARGGPSARSKGTTTTATSKQAKSQQQKPPPKSRIDTIKQNNPAKNPANQELANEFVDLGGYELEHGEKQKGISRMKVAKEIRNTPEPLKSGAQARQIPGIGPSAAAKVDEILHHGKMRALEDYESSGADDDGDEGKDKEQEAQEV